jgi:hypothetical protein
MNAVPILGRFAPSEGLAILRQRFVRRCHTRHHRQASAIGINASPKFVENQRFEIGGLIG